MEYSKQNKSKISEQTKQKHLDKWNREVVTRGETGWGEGEMGKGDQLYGDRWKLNFWW